MAVLSTSTVDPVMTTVACDQCYLPLFITNREGVIHDLGWQLVSRGSERDVCPACQESRSHLRPRAQCEDPRPADGGRLPDLCIIGAAKAGTTSLHAYLDQHPEIGMAALKELRLFADPAHAGWENRYRGLFPSEARLVGESSTMYSRAPALPGVAERMKALVPGIRLIYLVRDPVERALASYVEERFHGLEPRTVEEAFADLDDPYNPYVAASRYAEQLELFRAHFPTEQMLVLTLEQLSEAPDDTMRTVFSFLGVDPDVPVDTSTRLNDRSQKVELVGTASRIHNSFVGRAYRQIPFERRQHLSAAVRRVLARPIERPELGPDTLERLRGSFVTDVAHFQELTGLTPPWADRYR